MLSMVCCNCNSRGGATLLMACCNGKSQGDATLPMGAHYDCEGSGGWGAMLSTGACCKGKGQVGKTSCCRWHTAMATAGDAPPC